VIRVSVSGREARLQRIWWRNSYMRYHGVPQMLVFPYQAAGDRFSPIESTD